MPDPRLDADFEEQAGLTPATVEAVGKLSEAFETIEGARGHLYRFHQLSGRADFLLGDAVEALRKAGHADLAYRVEQELVGRNVIAGRWTFQLVEEYDEDYYALFKSFEKESRELTGGYAHVYEARLKRQRRSENEPGHDRDPDSAGEN